MSLITHSEMHGAGKSWRTSLFFGDVALMTDFSWFKSACFGKEPPGYTTSFRLFHLRSGWFIWWIWHLGPPANDWNRHSCWQLWTSESWQLGLILHDMIGKERKCNISPWLKRINIATRWLSNFTTITFHLWIALRPIAPQIFHEV